MKEELGKLHALPGAAGTFWRSDLFSVQGQHVTVGHLVIAFVLLIVGILLASVVRTRVSRALRNQVSRGRFHLTATDSAILEKGAFLVVLLVVVDVALNLVGVRPSTLHFLAGGLAVGVGFGAKELINNLISGVIVLVERPVKIGDIVQVDGEIGTVAEIGIRSIRLETAERLDVMLPNRVFLEDKVINWTKHNHTVLDKVSVGISYDTDIHRAMQVMVDAMQVEGVLMAPPPFVELASHGESALVFDAYFAVELKQPIERAQLQSRVNVALNDALRDHDIEIAYPQLDVHMRQRAVSKPADQGAATSAPDGAT